MFPPGHGIKPRALSSVFVIFTSLMYVSVGYGIVGLLLTYFTSFIIYVPGCKYAWHGFFVLL